MALHMHILICISLTCIVSMRVTFIDWRKYQLSCLRSMLCYIKVLLLNGLEESSMTNARSFALLM